MNQNDIPLNSEPEEQKDDPNGVGARLSGDIHFKDNQAINIQGDVVAGNKVNETNFHSPVIGPVHTGSGNINYIDLAALLAACHKWFEKTVNLTDIPPHLNTSWAGCSIYVMRQVTDGLSAQQWWTLITTFTLWVATIWLVTPILQWPLADAISRGRACLLYAIATLVIPLFVALTAPVDRQAEMVLDTPLAKRRFWFLKLTGAYTGFALAAGTIGVALLAYYLGWMLPRGVQWLLALVPLFFSHIAARRIPGDRLEMFKAVQLHEVDRLVVIVFLLLGPGVAAFIYWGYSAIANPGTGLLLLIALSGVALWEVRQRQRTAFADWALIAVFGLLLPLTFMLFVFYFTTPGSLPSTGAWWALALVTPYFLGLSLLVATIFVRNPPTLTIRGVLGLLAVILLLAYLTNLNVWLGRGLLGAVVLFWVLWGRRSWRRYFWVHASFGWMLIVLIGSVYLWVQTVTPHWIALVSFFLATGLLMRWAYQPIIKASSDAADYL